MKNKTVLGSILLITAALIWGSSFIVMKSAVDFLPPFVVLCIRFTLATIGMTLCLFKYIRKLTKKQYLMGAITGGLLVAAYIVQTIGLTMTSPSKNAFLTSVHCVAMPFLVWQLYKRKPDRYQWVAAILCFMGVGFVSLTDGLSIELGDLLTILGGLLFGFHMIAVKQYGESIHPIALTTLQFGFAAIYSLLGAILFEDISIITQISSNTIFELLYLAVFATMITLLCQNIGQHLVSECTASILLSLESVFGVFFSIVIYGEVIGMQTWIGFVCIFIAVIVSETKLSFLKTRRKT